MEKNDRLLSLDALRGFDMLFIMGLSAFVAQLCAAFGGERGFATRLYGCDGIREIVEGAEK